MIPAPPTHTADRHAYAVVCSHHQPRAAKISRASECREPGRTGDQKITAIDVFFVWHESPYARYLQRFVNQLRSPRERVSAVGLELHREVSAIRTLPGYCEHPAQVHVIRFPASDCSAPFTWHMLKACFSIAATAFSFPSSPYCMIELPKSGSARR